MPVLSALRTLFYSFSFTQLSGWHLIFFLSRDEKADWQLRSKGHALYPRYELVDEFRRHSEGQTFHIVKLSYFLELFGASEKVIKQVQKEETLRDNPLATIDDKLNEYLSKAIVNWIFANRQGTLSISFDSTGKGIPQLYIHGGSPKKCGAIYIFCPNLSIAALKIGYLTRQVLELAKKFDELMLFLVFPDKLSTPDREHIIMFLSSSELQVLANLTHIVGYLKDENFSAIYIAPKPNE